MSFGFDRVQSPAARRIKNLKIDEVSSVDRGAGRGVAVVLMKSATGASLPEIEASIIKHAQTDAISKAELSKLIEDRAEHLRKDGETREVAYARYISGGLGARLYTIMARSPGMDHHQAAALRKHARPGEEVPAGEHELPGRPDQDIDDGVNPFHAAIEKLVDKFMEAPGPGRQMTRAVAYDHVATKTKLGQDLFARAKAHDLARAHAAMS